MIKLLSDIPEVGKVPKHVGDAMFASDGQMGVAFACSLPVCVRVCTADPASADEISVSRLFSAATRYKQQEVNSGGAFRQIFSLRGVTVLFGASGGGGCAGGRPGSSKSKTCES